MNRISCTNDFGEWEFTLDELHKKQVDIACLSEINLALEKPEVKHTLIEKAKRMDKNMRLQMTSSKTNVTDSVSKRGGLITYARGNWTGRIISSGSEKLGRWNYTTILGRKNKCITNFTIYRVCEQKNQSGNCTIYMQQENDLKNSNRKEHGPREAILIDLSIQIKKEQNKGNHILVIGDVNEDLYKNNRIETFLRENGLYNAIKAKHKGNGPATYDRGKRCLDLIALSNSIPIEAIESCGYLAFYDGVFSDHRASYIDIKINFLFDRCQQDFCKETYKRFNTSNVKKCEKHISQLVEYLDEAQIEQKVDKLKRDIDKYLKDGSGDKQKLIQRSQTLFEKTTQLMIASEKRVGRKKKTQGYPSSQPLRLAGDRVVQAKKKIGQLNVLKEKDVEALRELKEELNRNKKQLKKAQND